MYLRKIAESEGIKVSDDALDALVHVGEGDMRKAVNSLQVAAASEREITLDVVYQTSGNARPEEIIKMLETALQGNFVEARALLDDILLNYGLSGSDIIKQIHKGFFDLSIPDEEKVKLIDKTGEVEFRIVEGSNERIQLESLLAYLVLVGSKRKFVSHQWFEIEFAIIILRNISC